MLSGNSNQTTRAVCNSVTTLWIINQDIWENILNEDWDFFSKIQTRIFDEKTQQSVIYSFFFFYLKTEIFPITSIVFITIQSFETLIECHLKRYEEVGWRWQAVIKMLITCSESDMTDQKCQIMLLRIIRVEGDLFIIHNILMRHLDTRILLWSHRRIFYVMTTEIHE